MLFQFESDFADNLRCIPMQVRLNLDTCGIKLKLNHWNKLSPSDRRALINYPCTTPNEIAAYRSHLQQLVQQHSGELLGELPIAPEPEWLNAIALPETVAVKASSLDIPLTVEHWTALTPIQRFALIKLSRSNHENHNFLPALREFGIAI
jgi:hypothetical protein